MNRISGIKGIFKRLTPPAKLQGEHSTLLHFGYHKSMTVYFNRVLRSICEEFGWHFGTFNSLSAYEGAPIRKDAARTQVFAISNFKLDLDKFDIPYRGSHIIRDPRDLLISGYKYHKWSEEAWLHVPLSGEFRQRLKLEESGISNVPASMTYQELLNSIDDEMGYRMEMNLREKHFKQMEEWNYANPAIFEIRYESIFNNERAVFEKLLEHYGFSKDMIRRSIPFIEQYSFNNLSKSGGTGKGKHASVGKTAQWKEKLPSSIKVEFRERYGELLIRTGYEKDLNW